MDKCIFFRVGEEKEGEKKRNDHQQQTDNHSPSYTTPRKKGRDDFPNYMVEKQVWLPICVACIAYMTQTPSTHRHVIRTHKQYF